MRFSFLFLLCCWQIGNLLGQASGITGQLVLPNGHFPTGNVTVLRAVDSSFVTGELILDGQFQLPEVPAGSYLLYFTSLEFASFYQPIAVEKSAEQLTSGDKGQTADFDLGILQVSPAQLSLDEFVVRAQRQVYVQRNDGTVDINVAGTLLAASSSTREILERSPDLTTNENGVISVMGKGNAIYYLNGQRVEPGQLALIAPANIERISIIRNPSARYDASGGAVIEITTLRQTKDGYRLGIQQNVDDSPFGGMQSYSALNLGINRGKLTFTANATAQVGRDRHIKFTTRDRPEPATFLSSAVTTDWQHKLQPFLVYGAGVQYSFTGSDYVSLAYRGSHDRQGGHTLNTNRIIDNIETLNYASDIAVNEQRINDSWSLNYGRDLDTLGSSIFIGGQYTHFKTDAFNPISEIGQLENGTTRRQLRNSMDLDIHILAVQVDYTLGLANGKAIDLGLRFGQVNNDADLDFQIAEQNQDFTPSPSLSSHYIYLERVSAAYANYRQNLGQNATFSFGLRAERTDYQLQVDEEQSLLTDHYLNLFPNASLGFTFSNGRSVQLNYSARINRPPYESLNPNLIYQDPYTSMQGNPALIPEKSHALELIAKNQHTTLKLGYTCTKDPLSGSALPGDGPRSYVLTRLNMSEDHSWYAAITQTFALPWWTSNNTLSVTYSQAFAYEFAFSAPAPTPQPYLITDNRFRLGKHGFLEVMAYYVGVLRDGTFERYDYGNLTLTYEKSLLAQNLKIRVQAADIFTTVRASGEYRQGATDIYFDNRWRTNFFRVGLTFDLNKLKKSNYKNQSTGVRETQRM
ncbi:MAG: outer membrane beta-barrel protein [Bacteroidota bacterium]